MLIRPCTPADLPAVQAIYAHAVDHGTGTFETVAPTVPEMRQRFDGVAALGLPWLVARDEAHQILGYAYAGWLRPRQAFRYCVEDSVYIAPQAQGQGVGSALLAELMARCTQAGSRQMVAMIGDSANLGSIRLHERAGFVRAGLVASAGWKFGRWLDLVIWQKALGAGDSTSAQPAAADGRAPDR
ncbi:GNAT family N-acetyltransferase [Amphibiibacter pelophylacis]|uniref:GNAT family N-acetyltransferase n=1 Tax=Amphibiibacter pelophylacis TaxID=1799477 RepID=A0ACC6NXY6_9BURK